MSPTSVEVAIVGGGQAGLAISYRLTEQGRSHVLLEQGQIVESWRTRRWDSLRIIAPNWSLVMPGYTYDGPDPDGFMSRAEVVERLVGYANSFGAPIHEGVRVLAVERAGSQGPFTLRTSAESVRAAQVVIATGALQAPNIPSYAAELPAGVSQLFPAEYRNPWALAPGGVLVVGGGQTGVQIAEELARAGRSVYLSMGRSWWAPRRYRGLDMTRWLRLLQWFERTVDDLPPGARTGRTNPQLTGAGGGHDISAHTLARDGVTIVGRLRDMRGGVASFHDGLAADLAVADQEARAFLHRIDAFVATEELDAPPEACPGDLADEAKASLDLASARVAPTALDLVAAGVSTIIWATGYHPDLAWVGLPFLAPDGHPIQRRGVTDVPGLFILGLDWQHTAKSGLFAGIDEDATYLAAAMAAP